MNKYTLKQPEQTVLAHPFVPGDMTLDLHLSFEKEDGKVTHAILFTKDGQQKLLPGDYLCDAGDGELFVVKGADFESRYELSKPSKAKALPEGDGK